ncbi:MAG: hypothetical protein PUD39_04670 [Bacteroidales bacterium]|nr:hypothetical protein [Bacteroidales bacterium]
MPTRQEILNRLNSNPQEFTPSVLANVIKSREHELYVADLYDLDNFPQDTIREVRTILSVFERTKFENAKNSNRPSDLNTFIKEFRNGSYVEEAQRILTELDDKTWENIKDSNNMSDFENYKSDFPRGNHRSECREILRDFDWYLAKKTDTVEAYSNYRINHPGVHDQEVDSLINNYEDRMTWENCQIRGTKGYKEYLNKFPNGQFASEARVRIDNGSQRELFLDRLRENFETISGIKRAVNDNKVSWSDVAEVYGEDVTEAIKDYEEYPVLPNSEIPANLTGNGTEVYFWGIKGSGKTCALGTVLSYVNKKGLYAPLACKGARYRDALKSLFKNSASLCILPPATDSEQIHEMALRLRNPDPNVNPKGLYTRFTFIDLPGELVQQAYELQGKTKEEVENTLLQDQLSGNNHFKNFKILLKYLNDRTRPKIHFFIFEYGSHDKKIVINQQPVEIPDCLQALMSVLKDMKVFSKSTVGIYLLMTKADLLPCDKEDRPIKAAEYFEEHFLAFKSNLEEICKKSYIGDFCGITFSIGNVYAQQICRFDGEDTEKLLRKLFFKSKPESDNWLTKMLKG